MRIFVSMLVVVLLPLGGGCRNRVVEERPSAASPTYARGAPALAAPAWEAQRGPIPSTWQLPAGPSSPGTYAPPASPRTRVQPTPVTRVARGPASPPATRGPGGTSPFKNDPSFEAVLAEARSTGRPLFLYFETMRCGWCDRLKRETFSRAEVQSRLRSGFVAVRYDAGQPAGRALAQRYGMPGYPVMVIADASGREIGRIVGYRDAAALLGEIDSY